MKKNMEKNLFHSVLTEMAVDRGTLSPPFKSSEGGQCVTAGVQSELQNTTKRFHRYDFQVMPSLSACKKAKRFPCMV
jgi:hypothetical protein